MTDYKVLIPEDSYVFIELKAHPREFDYRLDPDPKWELSSWYLDAVDNNRTSL